ncbi:hypothetical protein [Chitinophaga sp. sic0106]|uniref:hypothetical protein n=1 Tax=Chitinophaga sp. sic0106 TaxID=2854785 RepID=UPI001C43B282|nr:hypothetical protein [Chitinophaga sp. sic0106]MBV7533081.1 hypothetical protein [Chitinophaga sp. sic0106]
MILDVQPYNRLGQYKIGAGKQEISQQLDGDTHDITDEASQDAYPHLGLTFDYDEEGHCVSISAAVPAEAMYEGRNLLKTTFADIRDRYPNYTRMGNNGVLLVDIGIGLTFANPENLDKQMPMAVSIFAREVMEEQIRDLERWYRMSC